MKIKSAILVLSAALMMSSMFAGCGNKDMTAKGVRTNNVTNDGRLNRPGSTMYGTGNYGTYNVNDRGIYSMQDRDLMNNRYPVGRYGFNTDNSMGMNNNGMNRNGMNNYNANSTDRNGMMTGNMQLSQKIADRISKINGVDTANVMITDNNAYVAVSTESKMNTKMKYAGPDRTYLNSYNTKTKSDNLPANLKSQIADIVKKADPSIKNCYVSADANFVDRMNEYADHVRQGRPLQGLNTEFQEMINRLFPTNAANQTAPMNR
ncbi:YhcN/YlaJ family sporulation lipoprotein [Paenibacillus aquistagni]|uniref:Sporulation lipoprotein, YhcN/YlaJ family n=1 Tax=Paenibacillus aquistagni TaxID=1852522 RepID=A0A1X7LTH7_9BACL|nr:YhcN/YlaJ family sporulation lipoprotein [Paenibacillus aquistagni]SMG56623.1 sporulation lipoprotein, YhcN/YlaJ family [Paenibacillus aquistagni]